jgi:hypothetical protein
MQSDCLQFLLIMRKWNHAEPFKIQDSRIKIRVIDIASER